MTKVKKDNGVKKMKHSCLCFLSQQEEGICLNTNKIKYKRENIFTLYKSLEMGIALHHALAQSNSEVGIRTLYTTAV